MPLSATSRPDRSFNYQMVSLEHLMEKDERLDTVEDALARHKRRGEILKPTMDYELRKYLTPRQEQVLDLRLQQYSESEIAAVLGITQVSVSTHVLKIRIRALAAWGVSRNHRPG
ncbi:MAG: sigma factor-like helix-turn-helix DNA-binding protein [Dehalococcoidia bacterium]|nr:sigma factor-like helix-turn-helix DNA-binding protein [Dehalococcoidia bacterium]